ncbi:hypothetical protein CVD28_10350 [Bacillus sp. M6-12]|uniref:hypothetical protein n=1 Tax=Bacillus sp. M6-12 TaxID=2054166 RepID=UPI000C76B5E5|nr:hypothetical protein [Bacillus sp. M6-12]PLS18065.1 hypothetical protein CVD28_10350 [Bacillus sp. M6-12]
MLLWKIFTKDIMKWGIFIEELLAVLINNIKDRKHLKSLMQQKNIRLHFISGEERGSVTLNENERNSLEGDFGREVFIYGSLQAIGTILNGKTRLQTMIKRGDIKVEGRFREILLLESLFILCKPYAINQF